jgi:uncharacterized damage-inducible protein DinB
MSTRTEALAARLERGAAALAALAESLDDEQWRLPIPRDGRTIGVIVHHVASVYPVEIELAQDMAAGKPIVGVTKAAIDAMNAEHALANPAPTKDEAVTLLRRNSAVAAAAIRALGDADLDRAVPVSLYFDAPLTCQFFLEDHAVRHSYHHLGRIRAALRTELQPA